MPDQPSEKNGYLRRHATLLADSYKRLTGRELVVAENSRELAELLFNAPFVQLSHDNSSDPKFTYANRRALMLFEMEWDKLIGMCSRYSAEEPDRTERSTLLKRVQQDGFIDDYSGIRVSRSGRRFLIEHATVWNLIDNCGRCHGQAAKFGEWRFL